MKYSALLLLAILSSSCAPVVMLTAEYLTNSDKNNTSFFPRIGKLSSCDILNIKKKPYKIIQINKKKYSYYYRSIHEGSIFTFENGILCGVDVYSYNIINGKFENQQIESVCDKDDWNDELGNEWGEQKYKFLDMPQEPEMDVKAIEDDEFLGKILPGMKKGTLFRLLGKPDYSYEYDKNGEKWKFVLSPINRTVDIHEELNKPGKEYVINIRDNVVIDRYVAKILATRDRRTESWVPLLTDEEERCAESK